MNIFKNIFQGLFGKKNKITEPALVEQQIEPPVEPHVEPAAAEPQTEPAVADQQIEPPVEPQAEPASQEKPVAPEQEAEPDKASPDVTQSAGAEVEKLTRRIKELEGGLEAALNDVKDANKKLEGIQTEKKAAQEELDRLQAEHDRIKNEHDTIKAEHDSTAAEMKKLTRRIKELEDDLEDAQDDVKDANKKLERTQTEKKILKEEMDRLEAEHTRIKNEHETIKSEHTLTVKDLEIKKKSVDFVNEILNAPSISSRQVQEVAEKSTAIINFVKDSICEAFRESFYTGGEEFADLLSSEIEKWGNLQRKTWLKDKTVVAFIGEFSAGKTSIVNRIFTQDKKDAAWTLPVDRSATTAVATYISYGDSPKAMFTDPQNELRELPKDVFLQFTKESLDNISVSRLVSHFVTEYNTESLMRMSILDTPGFSSGDEEDERRTTAVINEADVLFWVVDANIGDINTKSLAIIKEHIAGTPIYVVINKVDTKAPSERKKIEMQMRKTLDKGKIPVEGFIHFSKEEPLEALAAVIGTVKPRMPDYDVIADINEKLNAFIQDCKDKITEKKKEAADYNRAINEADSIIEAFDKRFDSLKNRYSELEAQIKSNTTIFGNIKIEEYEPLSDKQVDVINKMLSLYQERTDAVVDKWFNVDGDGEEKEGLIACNTNIAMFKDQQKRLKNLKAEFNKKLKDFEQTKTRTPRQSSAQSRDTATGGVRFPEDLAAERAAAFGNCKTCRYNNGYDWCRLDGSNPQKVKGSDSCSSWKRAK